MSVGNDVVDLACPETRRDGLHPRFDERAFGPAERAALVSSPARHVLHWAFWAAKESAYKTRKRLAPETVFSPRAFEVELPALPAGDGAVVGRVLHLGVTLALEVIVAGECLHAVATSDGAGAPVLAGVGTAGPGDDPSEAARRLAAAAIGPALGLDPSGLRIAGRPPEVWHRDGRLDVDLSLSHHGRFVAFACARRAGVVVGFARALS